MRKHLLAAIALVPAAVLLAANAGFFSSSQPASAQSTPAPGARACDARCDARWMDTNLRLDQMQVVGTAESYKLRPDSAMLGLIRMGGKKDAEALDFGQPALAVQLNSDVRALSFDVAYDPKGGLFKNPAGASMAMDLLPADYIAGMSKPGFKVIHVLDIDYHSSCLALANCLKQVADWSRAHPRHLPIVITLHANDTKTPMPGATSPILCDTAALDALDGEIRAAFSSGDLITPDDVQGSYSSLRDAVLAHAWPRLGAARGKVMFVLDDSIEKARAYQGPRKSLEGRAMFVATGEDAPIAAFVSLPDPLKDGARIRADVRRGFMVVTRADDETREARTGAVARRDAAFASGAQVIQTDFAAADPAIGRYRASQQDNARAMCGNRLTPEHCASFEEPSAMLRTASAAMP